MEIKPFRQLPLIPKIKLAVIGHLEWVSFLLVDNLPKEGLISHAKKVLEEPAGGAAVAAIKMLQTSGCEVHLITALGKDDLGERSLFRLKELGLRVSVAWREKPTRKGISLVDKKGERAITVIGDRLQPSAKDNLPWEELKDYDGIFITAADSELIKLCRRSNCIVGTPRIGFNQLSDANVVFDALIGSKLDPSEQIVVNPLPKIRISTKGELGGDIIPGGSYQAFKLSSKPVDSYGCGDSFAAGVTIGLASGWCVEDSVALGAHLGANCATYFGPYNYDKENFS